MYSSREHRRSGVSRKAGFLIVVLVGLGVRVFFLALAGDASPYALTPDSETYLRLGENLAHHGVFSSDSAPPLSPHALRTPGYPLFLSLFSWGSPVPLAVIQIVQSLLGALTAGLLFWIARMFWGPSRSGVWAGLALGVDFVVVLHTGFILTETLFLFLFVGAFLLLLQSAGSESLKRLVAAGLLFGVAGLVRPIGAYVGLAFALPLAKRWKDSRRSWVGPTLIFLAATFLLPGAWMVRNRLRVGQWTLSTIHSKDIQVALGPLLEMERTGNNFEASLVSVQRQTDQESPVRWFIQRALTHPIAFLRFAVKETIRFWAGNSMKAAAWVLAKDPAYNPFAAPAFNETSWSDQVNRFRSAHPGLFAGGLAYIAFLGLHYALALRGAWVAWRRFDLSRTALAVVPILFFFLLSVGHIAHARLRIPAMPFVFLLAAAPWGGGLRPSVREGAL